MSMSEEILEADLLDGVRARSIRVGLRIRGQELEILSESETFASWPIRGLSTEDLQAGLIYLRSSSAPDAFLSLSQTEFARLQEMLPDLRQPWSRHERRHAIAKYGSAVVLLGLAIWLAAPRISEGLARMIPAEWEERWGSKLHERLSNPACDHKNVSAILEQLQDRLTKNSPLHVRAQIFIQKDSQVNAFALPGGIVWINSGLLAVADSPDELAGVLAHELQHIKNRDAAAGLIRGALLSTIWSITIGDYAGLLVLDPATLYEVANLRFSRDIERRADRAALDMLLAAEIDPIPFGSFFGKLKNKGIPAILSTHPGSDERSHLAKSSRSPLQHFSPALSAVDWMHLKRSCLLKE